MSRSCESARIAFGDACRRRDDRGNAAADRFVHRQAVRLVSRRMDEPVERRQDLGNVRSKAEETDSVGQRRRQRRDRAMQAARRPLPTTTRSASQRTSRQSDSHASNSVSNALRRSPSAPTKPTSGRSSGQPSLVRAAWRAAPLTGANRPRRCRSRRRGRASRRAHAIRSTCRRVRWLLQMTTRAPRSARRSAATSRRCVSDCFDRRGLRAACLRLVRRVEVVHPVGGGERTVAAVDDGARAASRAGSARRAGRRARAAGCRADGGRTAASTRWTVTPGRRREIGPRAVRDDVQFVAAPGEVARQRVVGAIHSAERREIAGHEEPRASLAQPLSHRAVQRAFEKPELHADLGRERARS